MEYENLVDFFRKILNEEYSSMMISRRYPPRRRHD
jgi:hypothetical protein